MQTIKEMNEIFKIKKSLENKNNQTQEKMKKVNSTEIFGFCGIDRIC